MCGRLYLLLNLSVKINVPGYIKVNISIILSAHKTLPFPTYRIIIMRVFSLKIHDGSSQNL